ncbi:hypothetical protein ACFXA3_17955, partial [Streptomyces sp. NPDC059456]|uniref:hypothetical protein n=1 Tax=Streptomyces sp. NPDC059456 TaxID=3346838 RepID=UPI0036C3AD17
MPGGQDGAHRGRVPGADQEVEQAEQCECPGGVEVCVDVVVAGQEGAEGRVPQPGDPGSGVQGG